MTIVVQSGVLRSPVTFSFSWVSSANDTAGGTSVTYSSVSFGAADANRIIVVGILARSTDNNTITGVTIGGVSATLVTGTVAQQNGSNGVNGAIYQAAVPTGTSGDVVVTYGGGVGSNASTITLYRVVTATPTRTDANKGGDPTNDVTSVSITIPSGGGGFAFVRSGGNQTWTNGSEDVDAAIGATGAFMSSATTIGTGSISMSWTTAGVVVAAAWGP